MEAHAQHEQRPLGPFPPARGPQTAAQRLGHGLADPVKGGLAQAGDFAAFVLRALAELRGVGRYAGEVIRQVGLLVTGSALVIWFMEFMVGTMCGTEANYVLRGYGATAYSGLFTQGCGLRELTTFMWGYVLSAKVGCGLVAEIGSMRINEELDAMEAQGINPMRYVVATRLLAAWIAFPLLYITGLGFYYLANYLVLIVQIGEVSQGGWELTHWAFLDPMDVLYAEVKAMGLGTAIVLIGMYFGYRARGGPVGVGTATARSMILNLIVLHVLGALGTMLFWGLNARWPIGG
ncbi:ABC transporter permease [Conexibacter sp. SYSU D00693]|uniref:ABC transporter permease n=1 Tax=Conexibacter sp. SYSU D00693 TaxID=2812560 RepID=UPI001F11C761|nr:ABC transporter permease [Conexibacter sp. SYSU D00693]